MMDKKLLVFVPLILFVVSSLAQIYYEGTETNQNKAPTKHNRQPIESEKCLEGEFLYPGDNEKDWACDCKPIFVYHPESMKCYQVYSRGPCRNGEYILLPPKKATPKCMRNQCKDGKVYFNGKCVNLNENNGACPQHLVVQVNSTSLQLTCAINLNSRLGEEEEQIATLLDYALAPVDSIGAVCLTAGKRSQAAQCI